MKLQDKVKERLEVGMEIKSYSALCRLLDEDVKGSNSKNAQAKIWRQYFNWDKEKYKQKHTITEIYDIPKEKEDGRINNGKNTSNSKYLDYTLSILTDYILDNDYYINDSFSKILKNLNLFNQKEYEEMQDNKKAFANKHNIDIDVVNAYSSNIRNTVESSFKSAFKYMKRNNIATEYNYTYMLIDFTFEQWVVDEKELEDLLQAEEKIYNEKNWTHKDRVLGGKNNEFKRLVSDEIGVMNYWKIHEVKLNRDITETKDIDYDELRKLYIDAVHKSTVKNLKFKDNALKATHAEKLNRIIWKTDYRKFDIEDDLLLVL